MILKPIFIYQDRMLERINPEEVAFLVTEKNYTKIVLPDESWYLVRTTLAGALKKLPSDIFVRVHRSVVVSIYHVNEIHRDHVIIAKRALPVGRQYYKSFLSKLNIIE